MGQMFGRTPERISLSSVFWVVPGLVSTKGHPLKSLRTEGRNPPTDYSNCTVGKTNVVTISLRVILHVGLQLRPSVRSDDSHFNHSHFLVVILYCPLIPLRLHPPVTLLRSYDRKELLPRSLSWVPTVLLGHKCFRNIRMGYYPYFVNLVSETPTSVL